MIASPCARDYITVLTVRFPQDAVLTKRLFRDANGAIGKKGYDKPYLFDAEKIAIDDLADLVGVLADLADQPDKVAIRGQPTAYHRVRRLKANFPPDPDGHHWMFLDFDEIRLPMMLEPDDDPELLLGYLVRLLPPQFHAASFYWQWSCGQGIDRSTLRAHLFFWCAEKHTDREFEEWAKWLNGEAGDKILDHCVFRTVQPNYTAAPIIEGIADPVTGARHGVHIGETPDVSIQIPAQSWEQYVRSQERVEYTELVEFGLRKPYSELPQTSSADRFLDYLASIGDDKDGFYEPMTRAIWHWARANGPESDDEFKAALRTVVLSARCDKQRDLEEYLTDYRLDASIKGAREKQTTTQQPQSKLAAFQRAMRNYSFTKDRT